MSRNYKFHKTEGLYFVSFAVIHWIDVFVRQLYFECLVKNLNYCSANKGMEIFAWCVMPSHVHLIFRSTQNKTKELLRDFKSYTAKELLALINSNQQESRRDWLMNAFKKSGAQNGNNQQYQ
ncbi:transposase [Mucilaginibacter sp.]